MNVFYKIQPRFLYCVPYICLYNQVEKAVLQQIPPFSILRTVFLHGKVENAVL